MLVTNKPPEANLQMDVVFHASKSAKKAEISFFKEYIGSVALLSHNAKVLALSKFALLMWEIYSCALEPYSTESLGH